MSTLDTVAVLDDPLPTGCGRVYTHKFGVATLLLSPLRHIVTCGHDCDVRTFVGLEDDDVSEFSLSSSKLTALVCYTTLAELEGGGADVVAVAMDDNTVQAFASDVSWYNISTIHNGL